MARQQRRIRIPECHPELPHRAKGMCNTCYVEWRRSYNRDVWERRNDDGTHHKGVVRVGVPGWGSL
jgi:hypothetical protein